MWVIESAALYKHILNRTDTNSYYYKRCTTRLRDSLLCFSGRAKTEAFHFWGLMLNLYLLKVIKTQGGIAFLESHGIGILTPMRGPGAGGLLTLYLPSCYIWLHQQIVSLVTTEYNIIYVLFPILGIK